MRCAHEIVATLALSGLALLWCPAPAAAAADQSKSEEASADDEPASPKWVIHSIEVSTKKGNPFLGRLTLKLVPGKPTDVLAYYWGGKCKKTKVPPSRLRLLTEAMEEGYSVQVPAFPIQYENSVIMCMQSVRVIKE